MRYLIYIFDGLRVNIAKSPSVSMKYNLLSNICNISFDNLLIS